MKMKFKLAALTLSAAMSLLAPASYAADSTASARASDHLYTASGMVVSGSAGVLAASGELLVVSVAQTARGVSVVVRRAADASGQVATVLIDGAAAASLTAGTVLSASATGVGYMLLAAGKAIAFIPNEIGMALLHQSSYSR